MCLTGKADSSENSSECHLNGEAGTIPQGVALLGQKSYVEAEPLLLQGYEGLKAREGQIAPLNDRRCVAEAGRQIVRLYEEWGRVEEAALWRTRLLRSGKG